MLFELTSEYQLQQIVQRCHNIIWERNGHDPAQAFDELSKLLLLKLYDERGNYSNSLLAPRPGEGVPEFGARIRGYFQEVVTTPGYDGIFESSAHPSEELLRVDDLTILEVLRHLQTVNFTHSATSIASPDIKGTIYEKMVGNTFRGDLGQFFTHRNLVEFMVRFLGIEEGKIVYDPACGSGGFLVLCAKLIREKMIQANPNIASKELDKRLSAYSRNCLIGSEINDRAARVARLNLFMHGLDYSGVFAINALKIEDLGSKRLRSRVSVGSIDLVFANPPFAGYEKDPSVLRKFDLGRNGHGRVASVTREVLFIELIIRLLREDGEAGIVIPQGVFTNRKLQRVREFIKTHARILAVIELPDWAFIPSGTSVRGSLLFLRKSSKPQSDYMVFMKRVENIGYTSTGRPSTQNDLPETIEEYQDGERRFLVPLRELGDRLDAKFHVAEHQAIIGLFRHNKKHKLVRLSEIGTFEAEKVNPHHFPDAEINLIETGCVDPDSLTIMPKQMKGRDSNYGAGRRVRAGDILISRRRAYRGAVVVVPPELDGALAIPEFSVFRLRDGVSRDYVVEVLRSLEFLQLMTIYSTGEMSGRISERDLRQLQIPLPENQSEMASEFSSSRQRIRELGTLIAAEREKIQTSIRSVLESR